jgi:hypothetical protein
MTENWSKSEVEAAVEDYFDMLVLELRGSKYNKTEHRRELMAHLNSRSAGSVEFKHQNISAVLRDMGIPFIEGYKPRSNYQQTLLQAITEFIAHHPEIQLLFQKDAELTPATPSVDDFLAILENPPAKEERNPSNIAERPVTYIPTSQNYLEREARNQSLGDAGEQFVINFERARLIYEGKASLAEQIQQVSISVGSSAGFDIHSFESNGTDRFIEVKTTKYGKNTPFFITPNELTFSQRNAAHYFLYRVFRFRTEPRIFTLQGDVQNNCTLTPTQFMARMG